ncbi:ribosomal protein L1 [Neocallimastix lanati (nom. inval.)]|uniref:Ribosomal protein L1 n=1 Tax=Neocallimastix californiae TaxID=1754190 RepID=A0A1Y2EVF4_9FUNG|nr:ribosomal protein L1 [Neocallimastix sp. JGI-2020a]ORY75572.1 ribosomal protein L1 [Neocallimastix californiae]|eukprot:ORY75572.1 ribosomal protein L1 [Neocallimastix californiae]
MESFIERNQIVKCSKAIHAFIQKERLNGNKDYLDFVKSIWLVFDLDEFQETHKFKPTLIPLKHTLFDNDSEFFVITKDPQTKYKEMIEKQRIKKITRVVGISNLRSQLSNKDDRVQLYNDYDGVFADEKIIHLLPKILGPVFYNKKKQPMPINLQSKNLIKEFANAMNSTYLLLKHKGITSVKIATTDFSAKEIFENITYALDRIVAQIPGGFKHIRSIRMKTSDSIALVLYKRPEEDDE